MVQHIVEYDVETLPALGEVLLRVVDDMVSPERPEHALAHGIETDKYDVPDVNVLDRTHAAPFVAANQIPAGHGVVIDDRQPYPVFGFIEARLHTVDIVLGGESAGHPHPGGMQP